MQKSVHVIQVMTAQGPGDKEVSFLVLSPVLDSVLSTFINTDANSRATMLGHKQVQKMINTGTAAECSPEDEDTKIIGTLYREEDSDLSDSELREIVSKSYGGVDISSVKIKEGVPGESGKASCVSVAGSVCLSHTVNRGYTTFYVKGKDIFDRPPYHRKYSVVNWENGRDRELLALDADTGEFLDIKGDSSRFGRHVESAYNVHMSEPVDVVVRGPRVAQKTVFRPKEGVEEDDIDMENLDNDPASVIEGDLAVMSNNPEDFSRVSQIVGEKEIDGENMAALVGAADKGFVKSGGTVMMPQLDEEAAIIHLESLFD